MPDHYSWFDELTSLEQRRIQELMTTMTMNPIVPMGSMSPTLVAKLVQMLDDIYEYFSDCVTIEVARQTASEEPMTFPELLARLNMTEEDLEDV